MSETTALRDRIGFATSCCKLVILTLVYIWALALGTLLRSAWTAARRVRPDSAAAQEVPG